MAIIDLQSRDRLLPGPGIYRLADNTNESYIYLIRLADMIRDCLPDVSVDDYRTRPGRALSGATDCCNFLSREETIQVQGFKSLKKQVEWIGGRYAVKTLAAQVLPETGLPEQIHVAYEPRGAPYLVHRPEISISISHAGDYAAAGICLAPGKRIGLDLEHMRRAGLQDVKRVAFTERELAIAGDSKERAFRIWTRKEAYLKFIKSGFGESLKRVDVSGLHILHGGLPVTGLSIRTLQLAEQYLLSIVNHG